MPHQQISHLHRVNSRRMRKNLTEAELKLWNALRAHRLEGLGFKRQMPIGNYIVDFACSEHRLIVEADGSQHATDAQINYDGERTEYFRNLGWQVVRFWNDDVLGDLDGVCQHIIATLGENGVKFEEQPNVQRTPEVKR